MDQKRKQDYNDYFDKFYQTVTDNLKQEDFDRIKKDWTVKTIGERVDDGEIFLNGLKKMTDKVVWDRPIPMQCDCPTHACEELCTKDCDNESWNKGLRKVRPQ